MIDQKKYHTRTKSKPSSGAKYPFNINPSTLDADFEVLTFGQHPNSVYIIPTNIIYQMYSDPEAYVDNHHPKIRVYTIDLDTNEATYARGGKKINLSSYRKRL